MRESKSWRFVYFTLPFIYVKTARVAIEMVDILIRLRSDREWNNQENEFQIERPTKLISPMTYKMARPNLYSKYLNMEIL